MKRKSIEAAFILTLSLVLASTMLRGGLPPAHAQPDTPSPPPALSEPALNEGPLDLPAEAPADWWTTVQENIRQSEYNITWQDHTYLPDLPAAYQAPNRAHNLRTYFTPSGIHVIPRTDTLPSWQWGLTLTSYGYPDDIRPVPAANVAAAGNRAEYRRREPDQDLTEWYVNDDCGLKQGITLSAPPRSVPQESRPKIILELTPTGDLAPYLAEDTTTIEFNTADGVSALRYGDLLVHDAAGYALPAQLQLISLGDLTERIERAQKHSQHAILITIETMHAVYPLTVGSFVTTPKRTMDGDQEGAFFGSSAAASGDVNGDGYADIIVGAPYYDNGEWDEGRAFVYYGSASGLRTTGVWTAENNQARAHFGWSVGTAGDVNGDGYDDVIVGALDYDGPESSEGRAYVYHGSARGLSTSPNWTAESNQVAAFFGASVGTAGNVNGDKSPDGHDYDDVIVGAHKFRNGQSDEGKVYVYHGSESGLSTSPNWTAESNVDGSYFGFSVGTAGDVNGDGKADVIVGAPGYSGAEPSEGRAYVYHGSAFGLGTMPAWTVLGRSAVALLGAVVGTAGDVNGDGYADVIVGASAHSGGPLDEGRAYIYHGSTYGLRTTAAFIIDGDLPTAGGSPMYSLGTAGDVNDDGYDDVIIGTYKYDLGRARVGAAFVYRGSATGLDAHHTRPSGTPANADWMVRGSQVGTFYGSSVGAAGDIDGDGYDDFIVGAPTYAPGGRVYVYYFPSLWFAYLPLVARIY